MWLDPTGTDILTSTIGDIIIWLIIVIPIGLFRLYQIRYQSAAKVETKEPPDAPLVE